MPSKIKASELQLADIVSTYDDMCYGTATVKQITDRDVVLFRPYVATEDFSWTGGVICYVGIEEYRIGLDMEVTLLQRRSVPLR